jgi:hypothetical protein
MIFVSILQTDDAGKETGRYWLVGDPAKERKDHTPAGNVQPTLPRMQQEINGTDWPYKEFEDRQNAAVVRQYSTTRLFDDAEEAWLWINSLSREAAADRPHPFSGSVVERFLRNADSTFHEERIVNAVVAITGIVHNGKSVELTYAVKGSYIEDYGDGATITVVGLGTDGGTTASYQFTDPGAPAAGDSRYMAVLWLDSDGFFAPGVSFEFAGGNTNPDYVQLTEPVSAHYATIAAEIEAVGIDAVVNGSGVLISAPIPGANGTLFIQIWDRHPDASITYVVNQALSGTSVLVGVTDDDGLSLIGDVDPDA